MSDFTPCTSSTMSITLLPECSSVLPTLKGNPSITSSSNKTFKSSIWTKLWPLSLSHSWKMSQWPLYIHVSMQTYLKACRIRWEKTTKKLRVILPFWFSWSSLPVWFQQWNLMEQETYTSNDKSGSSEKIDVCLIEIWTLKCQLVKWLQYLDVQ